MLLVVKKHNFLNNITNRGTHPKLKTYSSPPEITISFPSNRRTWNVSSTRLHTEGISLELSSSQIYPSPTTWKSNAFSTIIKGVVYTFSTGLCNSAK